MIAAGLGKVVFDKDDDVPPRPPHIFDEERIADIFKEYKEIRDGLHEIAYNLEHNRSL